MPAAKPTPPTTQQSLESKLDQIILHLEKMDKRDKWRTVGGFFKFCITIIPLILLLGSGWYFAQNWQEIMKKMATISASVAAEYSKNQSSGMLEQFMKQYSTPKK